MKMTIGNSAKRVSLDEYRRLKAIRQYTQVKPISRLTDEQMKSTEEKRRREEMIQESIDFKRRSWERG